MEIKIHDCIWLTGYPNLISLGNMRKYHINFRIYLKFTNLIRNLITVFRLLTVSVLICIK